MTVFFQSLAFPTHELEDSIMFLPGELPIEVIKEQAQNLPSLEDSPGELVRG
jgi:hypothetical protein